MTESAQPLRRVVIKEEFVALTGSLTRAAILGQLEYWQRRTRDIDQYVREENGRRANEGITGDTAITEGWMYKSAAQLSEETMLRISDSGMRSHLSALIERGWLMERNNPDHKWDRTKQYRLNLTRIAVDLAALGFQLQGWRFDPQNTTVPSSEFENGVSDSENGISKSANGISDFEEQYQRLSPEITSEITSEITRTRAHATIVDEVSGLQPDSGRTQSTVAGKTAAAAPARHEAGRVATMERVTQDQDTPLPPSRATQTIPEWFTTWHALYASANPERVVPVGEAYWMLHGIATKLAIKPTPSELLAKLKAHVDSEDWFKEGGKYVPSMRKYIHERWWERQAGPVSSKRWVRNGFVYPIYVQGKGLTWPPGHRVGQYDTQMPQVLDERGDFIPNPMLY